MHLKYRRCLLKNLKKRSLLSKRDPMKLAPKREDRFYKRGDIAHLSIYSNKKMSKKMEMRSKLTLTPRIGLWSTWLASQILSHSNL